MPKKQHHASTKSVGGELIVTNEGEVLIDEEMPLSPELLRHPHKYVTVEFDPHRHLPPPCSGNDFPDQIRWELIIVRHPTRCREELRLRIEWHVNGARAIKWSVKQSIC